MSDIIEEQEYWLEYYKSKLSYDFDSGNFIWEIKDEFRPQDKTFNTRFAGKEAGNKRLDGYIVIDVDGKKILAHRLAYLFMTGEFLDEFSEIDHINGNPSDNRWENLRVVNRQGNNKNAKIRKDNISGSTGVNWHNASQKYQAKINDNNGKEIYLGCFDDFDEAVKVRKEAEKKYNYHLNHGRKSEVI